MIDFISSMPACYFTRALAAPYFFVLCYYLYRCWKHKKHFAEMIKTVKEHNEALDRIHRIETMLYAAAEKRGILISLGNEITKEYKKIRYFKVVDKDEKKK